MSNGGDMKNLKHAVALAFDLHSGQTDKCGAPYILHPLGVLGLLPPSATEAERIAAVLHDVVEDCEWTIEATSEWYGDDVGAIVDALSKREGESNKAYIARVMANRSAMVVKLADMEHNSRACRSECMDTGERAYLAALYASQTVKIEAALAAWKDPCEVCRGLVRSDPDPDRSPIECGGCGKVFA